MTPDIERAVAAIRNGRVVGLPTDTVYGLGVDPFDQQAMAKLYELKGRPQHKPIGLLVASAQQAEETGKLVGKARQLAQQHWPGPLTLVLVPTVILADWAGEFQQTTVGVRVPNHQLALDLLALTGPLAVTSANLSGGVEALSHEEAVSIFGDDVSVYLEGRAPGGLASTVVDATGEEIVVLREGPVDI